MAVDIMLSFTAILLMAISHSSNSLITLENNGYKGIVVSIGPSVEEHEDLIKNIKDLFIEGSKFLYQATRSRSYFANITIVVPEHWSQPENEIFKVVLGGADLAEGAAIRIEANSGYTPRTIQHGGCGDPGLYMVLPASFIQNLHNETKIEFGPPERTLVHEWAHLRYGVFDEYGNSRDRRSAPFYIGDDNQIHATGCSGDTPGWLLKPDGSSCTLEPEGIPSRDCRFYPDTRKENSNASRGSLMNLHYLSRVDMFCDGKHVPHNSAAPNRQNQMCQGRSTWSVIQDHEDFSEGRNPPDRVKRDTTPYFRVVQRKNAPPRIVLLLDCSESMRGVRMRRLYTAYKRFIKEQVPVGSGLSVIVFSNTSQEVVRYGIVSDINRESIASALPRKEKTYGKTAIGSALQLAITVLENSEGTEGALLLLITDGEENIKPYIEEVLPKVVEAGVRVNTVALGDKASVLLETLTQKTGGRGYYLPDDPQHSHSSTNLEAAFFDSMTLQADLQSQAIQLTNNIHQVESGKHTEASFTLDSGVGLNTRIVFTSNLPINNNFSLIVVLLSPNNEEYGDWSNGTYARDVETRTVTFKLPSAQHGEWKYFLSHTDNFTEEVVVLVTTEAANDEEPIRVHAWIGSVNLSLPTAAKVYAEVRRGLAPVLEAHVNAEVERPAKGSVKLQLHDDGLGADSVKHDGIYSGFFTEFSGDGRYAVVAYVTNTSNTVVLEGFDEMAFPAEEVLYNFPEGMHASKLLKLPVPAESLPPPSVSFPPNDFKKAEGRGDPKEINDLAGAITTPVERFERSAIVGAFRASGYQEGVDITSPADILDLRVASIPNALESTVTLEWTSPGDDYFTGNASKIEFRFHTNATLLAQSPDLGTPLDSSHVMSGTLKPAAGGSVQRIVFKIPGYDRGQLKQRLLYFLAWATDDSGNEAKPSNMCTAYFLEVEVAISTPNPTDLGSGIIVLCLLVVVITTIIVFIVVLKCLHWRRKQELQKDLPEKRTPKIFSEHKKYKPIVNSGEQLRCKGPPPPGGVTYLSPTYVTKL